MNEQAVCAEGSCVAVDDVRVAFGSHKVLSGVTFRVPQGTMAGLIGPSGVGKSVLLKVIGEVQSSYTGSVSIDFCESAQVSLMFQEGALFDSLSVFDNIAFPLVDGRVPSACLPKEKKEEVREAVSEILARVGLSKAAFKMPAQLSGGMRRRVSLARALVSRPRLVLLDDPTCGLDPVASSVIMDLIVELHGEYKPTMLVVSHDLRRLLPVVQRVFALFDGVIQFEGEVESLRECGNEDILRFVACRYDLFSENGESGVRP